VRFGLLGELEVESGGRVIRVRGRRLRSLLACLLVDRNQPVSRDRLLEALWGERPPASGGHGLEVLVSQLRHQLGPEGGSRIETTAGGYRLGVAAEEFDVDRFERLSAAGRRSLDDGDGEAAVEYLRQALDEWRGQAFGDLVYEPCFSVEAARLEEMRLEAREAVFEAELLRGGAEVVVSEIEAFVAENPLREHARAQLMVALYRCGRQADALAAYRDGRRRLVDQLGVEPGPELQELEQAILRHDQALESPTTRMLAPAAPATDRETAAAPPAPAVPERRKIVTVMFCDILGSAAPAELLDPEALRVSLDCFFERMKATAGFHGGAVERVMGNASIAVFGVPVAHEDDALRACRAALELRQGLSELGLQGRIGLNSGEVVTGASERLVIGDAVDVAARLQQAAEPGDVLIGEATLELAGGLIEVESAEPLGTPTAEPVPAYRLLSVTEVEVSRPSVEARFVGRGPELTLLHEVWTRVLAEQRCELVTILGEAGMGKSRLVAEALGSLEARVVHSRCLPYGEGITYWPVVEVVGQLDARPSEPVAAASIRALLGESERATTGEEIAWAFRKLLEQEAPLVVVFDDVHSGEQTFLDLVEAIPLLSRGAPLLIVCLARPELLTKRPEWPVTLRLDPLTDEQMAELIADQVPETVRDRIAHAAGGNPLFVVELLAMAERSADVEVPATLQALLAARLDQLDEPERRLLEHAAVEGEVFHRGAVQALTPEEPQLTRQLAALARHGLIRPSPAQIDGEDGFRFSHLLLRDTAYDSIPKAVRSDLHEGFARWLAGRDTDLVELDELLGYHLEQACQYRRQLGRPVEPELAARARDHLTAAGRRAVLRTDVVAAGSLLERAIAAGDPEDVPLALQADLLNALFMGRKLPEAFARQAVFLEAAEASRDELRVLCLRVIRTMWRTFVEPEGADDELRALLAEAMPVLEAADDDLGLHVAWYASYLVANGRALMDDAAEAGERSIEHARRAGLPHRAAQVLPLVGLAHVLGSTRASELLAWADEQEQGREYAPLLASVRAWPLAWLGRRDEARQVVARALAGFPENAGHWLTTAIAFAGEIELLLGDPAAAAERLERACSDWEQMGERGMRSTFKARLAEAQYELRRLDEAEQNVRLAAELGASDDFVTQMYWRRVEAKLQARRGEQVEAERLAREAVSIGRLRRPRRGARARRQDRRLRRGAPRGRRALRAEREPGRRRTDAGEARGARTARCGARRVSHVSSRR
jgi:DNA-binding SARP family transcriptional activator